jgi:predicted cupin superfamily sugar epimerase
MELETILAHKVIADDVVIFYQGYRFTIPKRKPGEPLTMLDFALKQLMEILLNSDQFWEQQRKQGEEVTIDGEAVTPVYADEIP